MENKFELINSDDFQPIKQIVHKEQNATDIEMRYQSDVIEEPDFHNPQHNSVGLSTCTSNHPLKLMVNAHE